MPLAYLPLPELKAKVLLVKIRHLLLNMYLTLVTVYVLICVLFLVFRGFRGVWWIDLLVNFTPFVFLPLIVLFPVALLLHNQRAILLLLIPIMIVLLWFVPYFFPKGGRANANALRIGTFNAHIDNLDTAALLDWLEQLQPDIMLIQEVPRDWLKLNMPARLLSIFPYQVTRTDEVSGDGKAFLSRLPIVEATTFQLGDFDRFFHQRVVLDTPNGQIVIMNIHLMPNYGDLPRIQLRFYQPFLNIALGYSEYLRSLQTRELLTRLEQETLPMIVAGDFNTSEYSLLYDQVHTYLYDSFREVGLGFGMTWQAPQSGFDPLIPLVLRIDYLWHDSHFGAVRAWVEPPQGSDHLPVVAELIYNG